MSTQATLNISFLQKIFLGANYSNLYKRTLDCLTIKYGFQGLYHQLRKLGLSILSSNRNRNNADPSIQQYLEKIKHYEEKIREYKEKVKAAEDRSIDEARKHQLILDEKQQIITNLNSKLAGLNQIIGSFDQIISEKQIEIQALRGSLEQELQRVAILEKQLDSYKKAIDEKSNIINQLNQVILEAEHEAFLIEEKNRHILRLEEAKHDKDLYIAELEKALKEKDEQNDNLQTNLESSRTYISSLEWNLDEKDRTISDLNNELNDIKKELTRIKSSKVFRLIRTLGYQLDTLKYKTSLSKTVPVSLDQKIETHAEAIGVVIHCERPDLSFPIDAADELIFEGWALSKAGVLNIDIAVDGALVGKAEYGIRRNEIGRRYSDVPHASSSGFIYNLDTSTFGPGQHKIKITAIDKEGNTNFIEGTFVVKDKTEQFASNKPANDSKVICTIVNKNYLPVARVLTKSFLKHNPDGKVYLLLVDKVDGSFDPSEEKFELVLIEDLPIENLPSFMFKYSIVELSTAVKPYFMEYLFEKFKMNKLAYFDPDILITNSLDELFALLDKNSIVLTPHILHHYNDNANPNEVTILQAGTYNLGFIAVKNDQNARNLFHWWKQRLYDHCIMDPTNGYHVDQKWMDLAPSFFEGVFILREAGYNVAYWNLNGRKVQKNGENYYVNNKPLYFYHFSGFDPENIEQISKHQNRFALKDVPELKPLFEYYRELVLSSGYVESRTWSFAYGQFDNGVRIPDIARNMYRSLGAKASIFGNPFNTSSPDSFFAWLNSPIDGKSTMPISRLWYEIYKSRVDLINAFPDVLESNRAAFLDWIIKSGIREHKIDKTFLNTMRVSDKVLAFVESKSPIVKIKQASLDYIRKRLTATPASPPSMVDQTLEMGINLVGYFNGEFGVAEDARKFAFALQAGGIPHVLVNVQAEGHRNQDYTFTDFSSTNPYPVNVVRINADMTPEFFRSKGAKFSENKYNIGIWAWELPQFPDEWKSSFQYYNELWAISSFIGDSLGKISPVPVVKITYPFYLDESKVTSNKRAFDLDADKFTFLFIFDFLSVFERKNPLAIVKAFNKAFSGSDKVNLVLKCINSNHDPTSLKTLKSAISDNRNILLFDGHMDRSSILNLTASCDCYVSLHRSEGFGITMAEAMYLKKPVIATAWSGNTDFMNVNNSYPVKYDIIELDRDYGAYKKGGSWAEPNIEHAAQLLNHVYLHQDEAKDVGERASAYMKRFFNREVTAKEIKNRLTSLAPMGVLLPH